MTPSASLFVYKHSCLCVFFKIILTYIIVNFNTWYLLIFNINAYFSYIYFWCFDVQQFVLNVVLAGYQFKKSCTWWQVFEIWHGDRYGYEISKKHRKQDGVSPWWSECEQSNMAATGTCEAHISVNFTTRIKCNTIFHVFRYEESIFAVNFVLNNIIYKKTKIWWNIWCMQSIKLITPTCNNVAKLFWLIAWYFCLVKTHMCLIHVHIGTLEIRFQNCNYTQIFSL